MQGVPIQFGTRGDEMVRRPKDKFYSFLQGTHSGIWLSFYHMYQGLSALKLSTVFVYVRRGDPENILEQALGDVQ